jgi:hypothetical protein
MKKGLVSLVAASLLASSAMAVNIATDGTGDYLIAPVYSVGNNYNTKVKLVNTDNEKSFLIRAVVRDKSDSHEIFDFTLMMSPGDVWEGTFKNDGTFYSDDDSNWGIRKDGVLNQVVEQSLGGSVKGYVEFVVLAEADNAQLNALENSSYSTGNLTVHVDVNKVNKETLRSYFVDFLGAENVAEGSSSPTKTAIIGEAIDDDAIAGYTTIYRDDIESLKATLPMFAFENARAGAATNGISQGFIPGEPTSERDYINPTEIRDLLRYSYVSVPYDLNNANSYLNLTFVMDEESTTDLRSYKQIVRDMSENFPKEFAYTCPTGDQLVEYIKGKVDDFQDQDPSISPYRVPTCEIVSETVDLDRSLNEELDVISVDEALNYESSAKKVYKLKIGYQAVDKSYKTVETEEIVSLYDNFNRDDFSKGMLQIHDITNEYLSGGQKEDVNGNIAAYIPTVFEIKSMNGDVNKPILDWYYPSVHK